MRFAHLIIAAMLVGAAVPAAAAPGGPADVASAVAASERDAENVKLDEGRKPAELLQFLGLREGMTVIDMFGGNRYWSEILAPAVGPSGKVLLWQPTQFYKGESKTKLDAFDAKQANVSVVVSPFETPELPENFADFVLINLDYHDVYWESEKFGISRMEPEAFLKRLYASVKKGGIVGIIDHSATPGGDPRAVVEKLHRIDPAVVKADFEKAGFTLAGESDMYKNPADDRSLMVFDPKIRGKTDRFVLKFVKP